MTRPRTRPRKRVGLAIALAFAVAVALGGASDDGVRAYREGRFADALDAFDRAVEARGRRAPAELHYDRALAALAAGRPEIADEASKAAAATDPSGFGERRDFLAGNVAYLRAVQGEAEADLPGGAPPFVLERAIEQAEAALDAWRGCIRRRQEDWPEARRNVERALHKLEVLREKKEKAEQEREQEPEEKEPEEPEEEETEVEAQWVELTPEELLALFDKLERKRAEKREVRRAEQRRLRADVERDW